jgi:hypothetical protein
MNRSGGPRAVPSPVGTMWLLGSIRPGGLLPGGTSGDKGPLVRGLNREVDSQGIFSRFPSRAGKRGECPLFRPGAE